MEAETHGLARVEVYVCRYAGLEPTVFGVHRHDLGGAQILVAEDGGAQWSVGV